MATKISTTGSKLVKTLYRQFNEKFESLEIELFKVTDDRNLQPLNPDDSLSSVRESKGDGDISIHGRKLAINVIEEIRNDVGLVCKMFWTDKETGKKHLIQDDLLYMSISQLNALESIVPEVRPELSWTPEDSSAMIVAGRFAQEIAEQHQFYFCQNNRRFRPSKYIAFYKDGIIEHVHEIIEAPFDDAMAENTPEIANIAKANPQLQAQGGALEPGSQKRGMRLGPVIKVGPIVNDSLSRAGNPVPFTYGQVRYTSIELLKGASKTSELIHGLSNRMTEQFAHTRDVKPGKVDILWVIDNSGSMAPHQNMLIQESKELIDALMNISPEKRPRFTMHRTTTDGDRDAALWMLCSHDSIGPQHAFESSIEECGTSGDAEEKGLKYALDAIEHSIFLEDADSLLIVIVSDEDDFSEDSVQEYVAKMKSSIQGQLTIATIGGGPRYSTAVQLTGGKQYSLDSSGFNQLLGKIKSFVEESASNYPLKSQVEDPGKIEVRVNNQPYSAFKYHSDSNTIEVGKDVPHNALIEVSYIADE